MEFVFQLQFPIIANIGNFLNENKIDSPETLNVFIGVINENKKCCEKTF